MPTNKIHTLTDLVVNVALDMLDAERQLAKALPRMAAAAGSPELKRAFEQHLGETNIHAERLHKALEKMGAAARAATCHGMRGMLKETEEHMAFEGSEEMKDLALIAAARKLEHYEIASYGHLREWAEHLGDAELKKAVGETLAEEKRCDDLLGKLAKKLVAVQHAGAV